MRNILLHTSYICVTAGALVFLIGCQTEHGGGVHSSPASNVVETSVPPVVAPSSSTSVTVAPQNIIRIKAGSSAPFTDSSGNVWQAEAGFSGGDVIERDSATSIANTKDPGLFLTEHYSMESFSCSVPNGKYVAKLYFAETFEGIGGPGERVFSFNVQGREFKDFDVWQKAGGANHAYIETVPVDVTNGKFQITFTPKVEHPEINALELVPQT